MYGYFGILSVVVVVLCSAPTAYTRLCRGLEYLLKKIPYFIIFYLKLEYLVEFLIFYADLLRSSTTLPYNRTNITKNAWYLRLVTYFFTKLSQNVYLINTHIFI